MNTYILKKEILAHFVSVYFGTLIRFRVFLILTFNGSHNTNMHRCIFFTRGEVYCFLITP
jgi:hypothetical protein